MRLYHKKIFSVLLASLVAITTLSQTVFAAQTDTATGSESTVIVQGEPISILGETIQYDGGSWGQTEVTFNIPSDGQYKLEVKFQGNAGGYFKMKLDGVENQPWAAGNWVNDACGHDEWSEQLSKTETMTLTAGSHTVEFEGNNYVKYTSFTATPLIESNGDSSVADESSEESSSEFVSEYTISLGVSTSNGGSIGSIEQTSFAPKETITLPEAHANSGYKFSGWTAKKGTIAKIDGGDYSYTYTFPKDNQIDPTKAEMEVTAVFEKILSTTRDLPIVSVTTKDEVDTPNTVAEKEKEITSWVSVSNTTNSKALELVGQLGTIRGRGNSTWTLGIEQGKKPYRLKFDSKTKMLENSAKNKKWVLLANLADTTLLRNQIALDFSRTYLNNIPFTTELQQVELYINGEYQGVYTLCEQTEVAAGRVDITCPADDDEYMSDYAPTDDEISFLIERDADAQSEDFYFRANGSEKKAQYYTIKDGAAENPAYKGQQQTVSNNVYVKAIRDYINKVDSAIISKDQTAISNIIDVNSFVDMYILQELAKNCDVGAASFYLTKASGSKLQASPPWDFDRCFGNDRRCDATDGLYVAGDWSGGSDSLKEEYNVSRWFRELCSQSWFKEAITERFTQLYNAGAFKSISTDYNWDHWKNSDAVKANVDKFGTAKNFSFYGKVNSKGDYNAEIGYLKNWITSRISVLKSEYYDDSIRYNVSVNADSTMGTASAERTSGNTFKLTAKPNSGYRFVNWTDPNGNVAGEKASMTYDAVADVMLTANFEEGQEQIPNPQEVYAIDDGEINAEYISGSTNVRVDDDFLNVNGSANYAYALPFEVDDTRATTTYTISVYAKGQGSPYVIVWDGVKSEVEAKSIGEQNWTQLKTDPAEFTITGDKLSYGTNYAGVKANEYINLYKVVVTKTVSEHTHDYTATVTTPATCTEAGVMTYTCECGDTYTEVIPATGHKFSTSWTIDEPATCTEAGSKSHHCTVCDAKTDVTVIPAIGHNYTSEVTKAATCTEEGVRTYTCSNCEDTYTEVIEKIAHNYVETVVAPTTTEQGYTLHKCSVCGDSYKDNYVDPIDVPVEKPTFVKSTFSLEGVIGANLEYKISDTYVNGNYKIEVTAVSDNGDTKELTFDKNEKVGTNYKVVLPVTSSELTNVYDVTLAVKDAKGNEVTSVDTTVTVNAALNLLKSSPETGPLANALQTYGYYAQRNFGLEASDPIRRPADLSGIKRATVSAYKAQRNTVDNLPKSVPISTQSLLLEGQTTIRVYFGEIPENVDISKLEMVYTANGKTERSELQNNGTGYYADIANINAQELSNMYSIHVEEAGVQVSDELVYGAYSYVAANISSSDVNLQNTVKALYNYGEVAKAYFG